MCWWLDSCAVRQTLKLRDKFKIKIYIETGIFRGIGVKFYSHYFQEVFGCEINDRYFAIAKERVKDFSNVKIYKQSSSAFLKLFLKKYRKEKRKDIVLFYLDAHFYNPKATSEDKWVVLGELKALKDFQSCVICIHDFDCDGLGHLCYDREDLNFSLVKKDILNVNPNFAFYTNTRKFSGVREEKSIKNVVGISPDADTLETIRYHNNDRLQHRGILYCMPSELDLRKFELIKLNGT